MSFSSAARPPHSTQRYAQPSFSFLKASLSDQWTDPDGIKSPEDQIKWSYQLRFELESGKAILLRTVRLPVAVLASWCNTL